MHQCIGVLTYRQRQQRHRLLPLSSRGGLCNTIALKRDTMVSLYMVQCRASALLMLLLSFAAQGGARAGCALGGAHFAVTSARAGRALLPSALPAGLAGSCQALAGTRRAGAGDGFGGRGTQPAPQTEAPSIARWLAPPPGEWVHAGGCLRTGALAAGARQPATLPYAGPELVPSNAPRLITSRIAADDAAGAGALLFRALQGEWGARATVDVIVELNRLVATAGCRPAARAAFAGEQFNWEGRGLLSRGIYKTVARLHSPSHAHPAL